MTPYRNLILAATGCSDQDAVKVESLMRGFTLCRPLDGLSRSELKKGAREAYALLQSERSLLEDRFKRIRAMDDADRETQSQSD